MTITIDRAEIYRGLEMYSSFIGRGAHTKEGVPLYETVRFKDQDRPFAYRSINDAVVQFTGTFPEFVMGYDEDEAAGTLSIVFEVPSLKNIFFMPIKHAVFAYILNRCLTDWLHLTYDAASAEYAEKAAANLRDIAAKVYLRTPPVSYITATGHSSGDDGGITAEP